MRLFLPDHAGDEPSDGLDQNESGKLSARQHVVTDRDLFRRQAVDDPLIDSLVATAQDRQVTLRRQLAHPLLIEAPSRRRREEHPPTLGIERLHCGEERLRLHDHAGPTTERGVVDAPVSVLRPLAEVMELNVQQTRADRATEEASGERPLHDGGEDREHVDPHVARLPAKGGGAVALATAPPRKTGCVLPSA